MDVISILNSLENKILDNKNFGFLKQAYELQKEYIEQLKSNNQALEKDNKILHEHVSRLNRGYANLSKE